jgi:serine/threonine protein kinase
VLFLQILNRCDHPNIVRLLAVAELDESPSHTSMYLVFEYVENGNLETHLQKTELRQNLSFSRRVSIMYDVAGCLHFLHMGGEKRERFCHRDIKPSNICLTKDYTPKLIDCGLAKLIRDGPNDARRSGLSPFFRSEDRRNQLFGTEGYACPRYLAECREAGGTTFTYGPCCDVFSFGIVMLELITGCLQNAHHFGGEQNLAKRYEGDDESGMWQKVKTDIDPLLDDAEDNVVQTLSKLALSCTDRYLPKNRPGFPEIIDKLAVAVSTLSGIPLGATCQPASSKKDRKRCKCGQDSNVGTMCRSTLAPHFTCRKCLGVHVRTRLEITSPRIPCPYDFCTSEPIPLDELRGVISNDLIDLVHARIRAASLMKQLSQIRVLDAHRDELVRMRLQLRTISTQLTGLCAGNIFRCPRLVWIDNEGPGKNWLAHFAATKTMKLYFVCQHSFQCVSPPLVLKVRKAWLVKMLPVFKVCWSLLQVAGLLNGFPIAKCHQLYVPSVPSIQVENLNAFEQFVATLEAESEKSAYQESTGEAYKRLEEEANKDSNSGWKEKLTPVYVQNKEVIYVLKEHAHEYDSV